MNVRLIHYLYMVVLLGFTSSCISDDLSDCPTTQYVVQISVKDKNYKNIGSFPQLEPKEENTPFRSFEGTIYYTLSESTTRARIRESAVMVVNGEDQMYSITFNNIPEGEYILTVWGNMTQEYPVGILHQDNKEHTDIYMTSRKLRFDSSYQTTELSLERTKGLLLLLCSNFPAVVTSLKQNISHLYQSVDANFNYTGTTNVEKRVPLQATVTTFLAPNAEEDSSLKLSFYTDATKSTTPFLELPDINLTIKRNEISAIAIDYKATDGVYEIWMFIQEQWTMIHRLDIK
ncbi:hypothetical protein DXB65_17870 [Bacteroides oleiciplenus]|uniref:FimB/Mfa2 family fimbrial subunit n=2 Tax=Bacteroides oleiciplenus TaxID=626931 RepID=A0A3E5B554_9BACE|nr:hypothetical protein DXB65_17870 [Bacteroides oleiciplenus]